MLVSPEVALFAASLLVCVFVQQIFIGISHDLGQKWASLVGKGPHGSYFWLRKSHRLVTAALLCPTPAAAAANSMSMAVGWCNSAYPHQSGDCSFHVSHTNIVILIFFSQPFKYVKAVLQNHRLILSCFLNTRQWPGPRPSGVPGLSFACWKEESPLGEVRSSWLLAHSYAGWVCLPGLFCVAVCLLDQPALSCPIWARDTGLEAGPCSCGAFCCLPVGVPAAHSAQCSLPL